MLNKIPGNCFLLFLAVSVAGCSSWQPTKNVWKGTKGLWNTYVSPPASVDYDDKGDLPEAAKTLSQALMNVDLELGKLERTMQNGDKPPTQDWLNDLFARYPWLNGFAGVKYDGQILGQQPPDSMKQLDFIPLLYEDKKQSSHALRADVQPGPLGPEVMLAAPLYDGVDFLGIVVAYFDMRSLMRFSSAADDIVVLTPGALLWPGRYQFSATPLAGVDWSKVVRESTVGTCSNSTGSFFYMVRYLGNLPLIFATPSRGAFPEGDGSIEQGAAYFPQEREKLPPPPVPERKRESEGNIPVFEQPEPETPTEPAPVPEQPRQPEASDRNVIRAGSRDSVLLKKGGGRSGRQVRERQLEGENIEVIRAPERRERPRPKQEPPLELLPESDGPTLPGGRPSPFGPQESQQQSRRPSPFGPPADSATPPASAPQIELPAGPAEPEKPQASEAEPVEKPAASEPADAAQPAAPQAETPTQAPATLPGGRPSPFGPPRSAE
ncbi:MAG: hypothetical protein HDQ44_03510 [Desulfovibrio sp.]|nr:hypothetical protein [Desulfovibrio sp.]